MEQRARDSLPWARVVAFFLLITTAMTVVRWVLEPDAPWTDHLILGALTGAMWAVAMMVLVVARRRRHSKG